LSQNQRDPLAALREVTLAELMEIHSVTHAKATTILAAIELGERAF
jgi:DNA repair protein RadC